jgi:hypothetical protein
VFWEGEVVLRTNKQIRAQQRFNLRQRNVSVRDRVGGKWAGLFRVEVNRRVSAVAVATVNREECLQMAPY